MSEEKEFVNGLIVKAPNEKAPDFVKCSISIKREELMTFLVSKQPDEWINLDVKVSKGGKWYAEVNNWKPEAQAGMPAQQPQQPSQNSPQHDEFSDDIPFMRYEYKSII